MKHVLDDPAKVGAIVKRFVELHGGLNVALHLGRSRMLVVDVDTPEEREAFLTSWYDAYAYASEAELVRPPGITVESPGSYDYVAKTWKHFGGGHWWFTLPDEFVLPPGKVFKGAGGFAIMYGEAYCLVPPASRPEGLYRLVGGTNPTPSWMLETLSVAGSARGAAYDAAHIRLSAGGPIDRWSATTSWASLLEPRGWIETSMADTCGCPVWTAPGDHASPKSATAHDLSCGRFDVSEGWGPLKIWTDHPPDGLPASGAVTKLQFVALTDHGGSDGAAMDALRIERPEAPPAWAVPAEWQTGPGGGHQIAATLIQPAHADDTGQTGGVMSDNHRAGPPPDPFGTPAGAPPDPSVPQTTQGGSGEVVEQLSTWDVVDLGPYLDGTYRPPVPAFLHRNDGLALLYPGLTHSIYGETESAKSWISLLACAQAIKNGQDALFVDLESDAGQVTFRLRLLGCTAEEIRTHFHYVSPWAAPADAGDVTAWLDRTLGRAYAVAVIDAMSGALNLFDLKPNESRDITKFYAGMPSHIVARTGAALAVVDHVIKDKDTRGRWPSGSERKVSALTGAALSVRRQDPFGEGMRGTAEIWIARDRAGGLRGKGGLGDRDGMQQIGTFVLDSSIPSLFTAIIEPQPAEENQNESAVENVSLDVQKYLMHYGGANSRAIREAVPAKAEMVTAAVRMLVDAGTVRVESGARGAHHHYLTDPLAIVDMSGSRE